MLKWLSRDKNPLASAVLMVGVKAGDRVLFMGPDAALAAALAQVTGLNGQTVVVAPRAQEETVMAAAARAGALVEFVALSDARIDTLPGASGFDVAVWADTLDQSSADSRTARIAQLFAALRPGGRVILVDRIAPASLLDRRRVSALREDDVLPLLQVGGGAASRALGVIDGRAYYESRKGRAAAAC